MADEENEKLNTTEAEAPAESEAKPKRRTTRKKKDESDSESKPATKRKTTRKKEDESDSESKPATKRKTTRKKKDESDSESKPATKRKTTRKKKDESDSESKPATKRKTTRKKKDESDSESKPATKRKTTRKKKTEELENQQAWDLEPAAEQPEKPAEEPAPVEVPEKPETPAEQPADDGTREISIEDYQPVIWVYEEEEKAPSEDINSEEETPLNEVTPSEAETGSESEISYEEPAGSKPEVKTAREYGPEEKWEEPGITSEEDVIPSGRAVRIAGAVFFGVLVLMFVLNIITKDTVYSDQENRVFQQFPKFSISNYLAGRFESQLDNYASDQFAGRSAFIKIKSSADLTIGQIKANGVFKAKENYLMEDIAYPDEDSFNADITALKQFKKKYHGKKMYFMLVPNAANILADKLPGGVVTHDQNKDMDKLFKAVEKMGYKPIDVRDELTEASKKEQVYYRTDHHWTTDGAYIAYQKAAKVMKLKSETEYKPYTVKKDFVGTLYSKSGFTSGRKDAIKIYLPTGDKYLNSVIRYKDKKEKTTMYYDMANLDIKDAYTVFGGTNQSLITISTPTKNNKHLLVVKDSYANCFIPFLTQDYRTITIVDPRYYYENIATVMKADEIDDVLFLYNANTFFDDNYMRMMLTNK